MSSGTLQEVFTSFASFGASTVQRDMDSAKFSKLCKDTNIIDKRLTKTDVDLIFTKVKAKGERRIDFNGFVEALQQIADKKCTSLDAIMAQVVAAGGPSINGTVADAVRFHDDKSTYTGVYGKGGPTNIDRNNVSLNFLLDRTSADVRGVKPASLAASGTLPADLSEGLSIDPSSARADGAAPLPPPSPVHGSSAQPPSALPAPTRRPSQQQVPVMPQEHVAGPAHSSSGLLPPVTSSSRPSSKAGLARSNSGSGMSSGAPAEGPRPPSTHQHQPPQTGGAAQSRVASSRTLVEPEATQEATAAAPSATDARMLEEATFETFKRFCAVGSAGEVEIDSFKFSKMLKDTNLLDAKKLTKTSADLIFTKAKAKGAKKMSFTEFKMIAVPLMAQAKGVDEAVIYQHIAASSGPRLNGTVPDAVRFHDDKSTFTGVYARGGPTNVDGAITLSNLADRSDADVRGVKPGMAPSSSSSQFDSARPTATAAGGTGGDIYDRLTDVRTYTGVYAKRFEGGEMGGRINDDTVNVSGTNRYTGSTSTVKTDAKVRDLSDILTRR